MDFLSLYSAYILDFDGTLADTAGDIMRCMHEALARHHLPEVAISPYDIGPPLDKIFRQLVPDLPDETVLKLVQTYRELYNNQEHPLTRLYPGILPLLERLACRGALCCMATNKSQLSTLPLLEHLGVARYFSEVLCSDTLLESLGRKITKAEMIMEILKRRALDPATAIMIGDSAYDIEGGKAAGVHTMAVLYGYGRPEVMRATGADAFVCSADWKEYVQ